MRGPSSKETKNGGLHGLVASADMVPVNEEEGMAFPHSFYN